MSENATRFALQQRIQSLENEAVTLRKTVDRLRMSDKKYRRLVEHANEAVLVSQGGVFKYANPRAEVLFGFSQAELASRPLTDFIHPDDRDLVRARHEKRLRGEDPPDIYPFKILTKASQVRWVELKVSRFSWENAPAALSFLTDITARKQAQAMLDKRLTALTRPPGSELDVTFEELFALDDIQRLQDQFAQATGVASIITRT
ncbi:MAG: PAS domain S-box protein, partial [Desulfobacterales bacterium]|nr:PAS domain S-box protein [Desulfobacterales bacterium]